MTWAPDYVTSAELKSYIGLSDNADDAFIAAWITTVSRNVDDFCGRQFGSVPAETREYPTVWDRHLGLYVAEIDDLMDEDITVIAADVSVVSSYTLEPVNNPKKGKPFERITCSSAGPLTIEAPWGWTAVPAAVKTGVFLQGNRLKARRKSPFGISGSPQEQGELRLLAQLDPDFRTSLKPLVRDWWAA